MKVLALVSGGKDSCFNMMKCIENGHEIVALAHLKPKDSDELDSYMYQSVGHEIIDHYAEAMGLPLFQGDIVGKPHNQASEYEVTEGDEVEDLFKCMTRAKEAVDYEAVSVGAIFSDYQRVRVLNVCDRLGVKMLAYLWHRDQAQLLREMVDCNVHAILIKVAALGLEPHKHLGKTLAEIYDHMISMEICKETSYNTLNVLAVTRGPCQAFLPHGSECLCFVLCIAGNSMKARQISITVGICGVTYERRIFDRYTP
ncbi:diphthine--ammonia ligase isoform X2 [Dermacentor variabilis]|uniref:diphthine--ammonia ligase isoform X2 n=1 Tax=Dermacentor variabilis TaxID=34621 RepID=UPI003F5C9F45